MNPAVSDPRQRIARITLDEHTVKSRSPDIDNERAAAIGDLLIDNRFAPVSGSIGPFDVHMALEENRLNIEICSLSDGSSETVALPLAAFRRLVKDYFMVCESYYQAIRRANLMQVEALDAGRRSLHDEASALLVERLGDKVVIDHHTARRLFTLICVLHLRG
ncbi:MAG: UPF0262 family protein [Stellaceae bacterium]